MGRERITIFGKDLIESFKKTSTKNVSKNIASGIMVPCSTKRVLYFREGSKAFFLIELKGQVVSSRYG